MSLKLLPLPPLSENFARIAIAYAFFFHEMCSCRCATL